MTEYFDLIHKLTNNYYIDSHLIRLFKKYKNEINLLLNQINYDYNI